MINAPAEWDPSLNLGHDLTDKQHRALFDMILELDRRVAKGEFGQGVLDALHGMKSYAASHFAAEENFMARAGWPKLAQHQGLHAEFLQKTSMFGGEALIDSEWTSLDLLRFLLVWLVKHVKVQDREFFDWMAANRPSA